MIFLACVTLPETAEEWIEKGQEAYEAENYDESVKCFQKAVSIKPNDANAHYNLGFAYDEKGLNTLAAEYLYKAGLLYLEQGDREGALKAYEGLKPTKSKELEQSLFKELYPKKKRKRGC